MGEWYSSQTMMATVSISLIRKIFPPLCSLYVQGTSSPPQSAGDAAAPSRTAANQVVTAVLPDQGASAALAAEQPHFRKNVLQQCNVNIVKAELEWCLSGKPKFTPLEQLVTDASTNINYILLEVQRKWGGRPGPGNRPRRTQNRRQLWDTRYP